MDKASLTIDRHTPEIPESIWFGLEPGLESIYTRVKNRVILKHSKVEEITKWGSTRGNSFPPGEKKQITDKMLSDCQWAWEASRGILKPDAKEHLIRRGVTEKEIEKYGMCSTSMLTDMLNFITRDNMSLRIPDKFKEWISSNDITGITIPSFFDGLFCGFATRVLNEPAIKYAISIPHRICFGVDLSKDEVYIVEGVFDSIAMHRIGYNALGMADSQPNFFKMSVAARFKRVNLLLDNDYAGWVGAIKAYIILTDMLKMPDVNILALDGDDPEELIRSSGKVSFSKITIEDAIIRAEELGQQLTSDEILL